MTFEGVMLSFLEYHSMEYQSISLLQLANFSILLRILLDTSQATYSQYASSPHL
jgi:hypothetical protein